MRAPAVFQLRPVSMDSALRRHAHVPNQLAATSVPQNHGRPSMLLLRYCRHTRNPTEEVAKDKKSAAVGSKPWAP